MKKFKDLNKKEQGLVKDKIYNTNVDIASLGLLGFTVKKLAPTKKNLQKFQEQFNGHPICGCVACLELAKTFVKASHEIREEVITESMNDLTRWGG